MICSPLRDQRWHHHQQGSGMGISRALVMAHQQGLGIGISRALVMAAGYGPSRCIYGCLDGTGAGLPG